MTPRPRLSLPRAVKDAAHHTPMSLGVAGLLVLTLGTGATALTAAAFTDHAPHRQRAVAAPAAIPTAVAALPTRSTSSESSIQRLTATPAATATAAVARVPRPKHLVQATLLITGPHSLTRHQRHALNALPGVRRLERVAAGPAAVDGHRAFVMAVNPATFRPWTPKLTARSNPLWASIARGELAASFDMGKGAKLPLGATVPVRARRSAPIRIGAFASVGMSGVDAMVTQARGRQIGLRHDTGVILSAPKADPLVLRKAALAVVGRHGRAQLLRQLVVTRDAGEYLTRQQITTFLHAAASRVGLPYVWGATGPKSFDCSGLVQWSFARAGIRMPRVSEQQWLTGPHISYGNARPGDLLFWHYDPTDPNNVDHVAIYAGNGMMLVAPHTGENVSYKPVPLANLAGVVRVDPALAGQIS